MSPLLHDLTVLFSLRLYDPTADTGLLFWLSALFQQNHSDTMNRLASETRSAQVCFAPSYTFEIAKKGTLSRVYGRPDT